MHLDDFLNRLPKDRLIESDGYLVHCPAHDDSRQSLRVTVSDKGTVLVKCRAGCKTEDVMAAVDLSMRDLMHMTAEGVEAFIDPATSTEALPTGDALTEAKALVTNAAKFLNGSTSDAVAVREMLWERFGIDRAAAERLRLGAALDGTLRALVPFRTPSGEVVGWQARAVERDAKIRWTGPRNPKGASWSKLAFFPGAGGWSEVIVTEGPGDALTACAVGYDAIAIRGAALANSATVQEQLAEWTGDRPIILAGDNDTAGQTFNDRLAEALLTKGRTVSVLTIPTGSDINDWRENDRSNFSTALIRGVSDTIPEAIIKSVARASSGVVRDLEKFPTTDLGNAKWCLDRYRIRGSDIHFVPERGKFLILTDGIWRVDTLDSVRTAVQNAAEAMMRFALDHPLDTGTDDEKRHAKHLRRWATYSQSSNGIRAAMIELQALDGVAAAYDAFDAHPELLAVRNGVVNLRTGELLPHDASLLLTKRVDLDYDPGARSALWEKFLREIFENHADVIPFMQRLVGYGITGSTDEQCFAVFWGTGANGKSTLTDTLSTIVGDFTVNTPFSTFEAKRGDSIPNDIAALKGNRLILASEGDSNRPMAEATLKRMSGGDKVSARFMRQEFFEFTPEGLIILTSNNKPEFRGQDEGLWRRVKMIPFSSWFAPENRDPRLKAKLCSPENAQAILAWAIHGAMDWYRDGLRDPETIRNATRDYRIVSDKLAGFIGGRWVIDPDAETRVKGSEILTAYKEWAHEEGYTDGEVWRRNTFYSALEERGAVKHAGTRNGVMFSGIRKARPTEVHESPIRKE